MISRLPLFNIHLTSYSVPPNLRFEIDDAENEWVYSGKFDLIHVRMLGGAIRDWPRLVRQAFQYGLLLPSMRTAGRLTNVFCRFTKPGGWVEFFDFTIGFYTHSGEYREGCATDRWCREVSGVLESFGLEPSAGPKLLGWIEEAGFTDIHQEKFYLPVGTWPKDKKLVSDLFSFYKGESVLIATCRKRSDWSTSFKS